MKREFSFYGFGGPKFGPWSRPFPAIELGGSKPELKPYGRAKVARVDFFPELEERRGALLNWPRFEKKGYKWIVAIGKSKDYNVGRDVQILVLIRSFEDTLYYARPMAKGNNLWGPNELSPVTNKLLKLLSPAYRFQVSKV